VIFVGTKDKGNVYALVDEGKDYTIDRAITLATKLNMPNGVAYKDGTLYIAEVDRILKASNILNTLDKPIFTTVLNNLPKDEAHGWKYIAFGPDGMLYVPIGAPCNICNPDSPYASLWRYDTQTRQRTLVAQGIRNTVGFTRQPESDNLWFTDNGRDRLGDNNPPDELNQVIKE
jgi:glucose/arabinose dehydrogenase